MQNLSSQTVEVPLFTWSHRLHGHGGSDGAAAGGAAAGGTGTGGGTGGGGGCGLLGSGGSGFVGNCFAFRLARPSLAHISWQSKKCMGMCSATVIQPSTNRTSTIQVLQYGAGIVDGSAGYSTLLNVYLKTFTLLRVKMGVIQRVQRRYALSRIQDQHFVQQIHCVWRHAASALTARFCQIQDQKIPVYDPENFDTVPVTAATSKHLGKLSRQYSFSARG